MSPPPNHDTSHSEIWTLDDLRAYAESMGYVIELLEGGAK